MVKKQLKPTKRMILRLCRYLNYFITMKGYGAVNCLSDEIADALKLTPAQVRKDFSVFKITGRKKAGYKTAELIPLLTKILSRNNVRNAIVAGTNPLGAALLTEPILLKNQINLLAAFSDDPAFPRSAALTCPLLQYSELRRFVKEHNIKYAILTVTSDKAQAVLDKIVLSGITSILSFSTSELKVPAHCNLHNINIAAEFDNMVFFSNSVNDKNGNGF
ncbi:MAG: redox-sensing transcriptional repressor Rex [Fibrobacteres bacterium]|nr:redox-sensing transcriptional repressor Rex [Fibrobacterota bacterium]